ncbi:MAG: PQQ-like beta-propeller repeat protein [Acidobacteriota bacterium]|nr:PQQ-like beta-propeller repeat protein [Acidobacteriota bacterium]
MTFAGEILALDDASGAIRWRFGNDAPGRDSRRPSSPAASQDTVYYGSADGKVFALDAATGTVRWTRALGSPIQTPLTLWGKTVSFGTEDRRVCRLDVRDGSTVACRSFDELPAGKPLVAGDSLIVLFGGSRSCCASIAALDSSLRTRWVQAAPDGSAWDTFRPAARGDAILIGSDRGELFAFRLADGAKRWSRTFGGPVRSIGSANGILYVGTLNGTVYAYEPGADSLPPSAVRR